MGTHNYVDHLRSNEEKSREYYLKSFQKTEQQIFLEEILPDDKRTGLVIGDFAAGAGTLSYHLNNRFDAAQFYLFDLNEKAVQLAKDNIQEKNFYFFAQDIYQLEEKWNGFFDYVFCWQTLLLLEKPELALRNLIGSCKSGGSFYLSSLFNVDRDVDVYARFVDHTRDEPSVENALSYNTYCEKTIDRWIRGIAKSYTIHPFKPTNDLKYEGKGIGTHTVKTSDGDRLQVSGGMLMNWAILKIVK